MASSLFTDPLQMWREALTKFETEVNSLATEGTKSNEVMRSLHQLSATTLGFQRILEKAIGAYLRRANLPSREDVAGLGEALRRIEDKLDRLLPADAGAAAPPRPARTRRPAPMAAAPAPEAAPAPAPAAEPARPPAVKRKAKAAAGPAAARRGRS